MVQNICCFISDFYLVCIFGSDNHFGGFFTDFFENFIQAFVKKVIGVRTFFWIVLTVFSLLV